MTTAINANATSERELTSDEIDTVSGGASARTVDQDWSPGGGGVAARTWLEMGVAQSR